MILAPATIGIIGGGQLGRLFTQAAQDLGYQVCVLEPDEHSPAGMIADQHIVANYDNETALEQLSAQCAVITTEFENISAPALKLLAKNSLVCPQESAVAIAQDRILEKAFIQSCGLRTAPYGTITTGSEIATAVKAIEFPCLLKTARFGYDGKGQITVHTIDEVRDGFAHFNHVPCVLEQRIDLEYEVSVILGRNSQGESRCFPVAENTHIDGILHKTMVPSQVDKALQDSAQAAAIRIADKLDYRGVLAVEFFISQQGELLINEIAPRTHNSGHYTLDACVTSQFEQQVRMVCDLPFGDVDLLSPVVMINLLGDCWGKKPEKTQPHWDAVLSSPATKLHLYAKKHARQGRKMGHYCSLADSLDRAEAEAELVFKNIVNRD